MVTNQGFLFLIFVLNGIIIGLLFDFFRILRRTFKTNNLITYIEDIIFWICTGLILIYSIFTFNNGEIRIYMLIGVFIGCVLYMLLISSYFIKINVQIILFLKRIFIVVAKIIISPIKLIINIIRKVFFKPINFITINIKKLFSTLIIKIKQDITKTHKIQKNKLEN